MGLNLGQTLSGKLWDFPTPDIPKIQGIRELTAREAFLATLISFRVDEARESSYFLNPSLKSQLPDPLILPDMEKAIDYIHKAIVNNEKIAIWGDYDVDGATSTALLVNFFQSIGLETSFYIPDRFDEGYGLNRTGLKKLHESGILWVICVDCGSLSHDVLQEAASWGLKVIIIDHHTPQAMLPCCYAMINPRRLDVDPNIQKNYGILAAVGLTFLFVIALNQYLRHHHFYTSHRPEPNVIAWLDLVALGTVCDVVPLKGLNRCFVIQGLKILSQTRNQGLKDLIHAQALGSGPLSAVHLAFFLGPCLNSGGRMGPSFLAAQLLSSHDASKTLTIAQTLTSLNSSRQSCERALEAVLFQEALCQKDAPCIIIAQKDLHVGVIGILAARLKDKFNKPSCVISLAQGLGKGSLRSVPGVDIGQLLHEACRQNILITGGGHPAAAGLTISESNLSLFRNYLCEAVACNPSRSPSTITCEGLLTFQDINCEFIEKLKFLEPHGSGNPRPRFAFKSVRFLGHRTLGHHHSSYDLQQRDGMKMTGMVFWKNRGIFSSFIPPAQPVDVVGTLSSYRSRPQLILEDVALSF